LSLLLSEEHGDVVVLKLNRPEKGNSLNEALLLLLKDQLSLTLQKPGLKAVILTGMGDRFFCTGADLTELLGDPKRAGPLLQLFTDVMELFSSAPVFTACFLNGDTLGGAVGISLSTDFVLAREGIKIGTPEITKGVFPFMISKPMVAKLGYQKAMAMSLGGKFWDSKSAFELGMVSETADQTEFPLRMQKLIELWNAIPRSTVLNGKMAFAQSSEMTPQKLIGFLAEHLAGRK